jgi:hypothetical protein
MLGAGTNSSRYLRYSQIVNRLYIALHRVYNGPAISGRTRQLGRNGYNSSGLSKVNTCC